MTDANPLSRRNWGHALRASGYLAFGMVVVLRITATLTIPEEVGFELRGTVVRAKLTHIETHEDGRHSYGGTGDPAREGAVLASAGDALEFAVLKCDTSLLDRG